MLKIDYSHHAYCLEGNLDTARDLLYKSLENNLKISTRNNPDFLHLKFGKFGIDDGRRINNYHSKKALNKKAEKIIVIEANTIPFEAQNSLLKMFEEPSENTKFFLIIPNAEILLPTLKSRFVVEKISADENINFGKKFLKASTKERIEIIKKISEEKDKKTSIKLLNEIENIFYKNKNTKERSKEERNFLKNLIKTREYMNDRSPSIKMLLEHVSLIIPKSQ